MKREVRRISKGDYVVATKYGDGDPQDHWCVGFFDGLSPTNQRYMVNGGDGKQFRSNGFRRIRIISPERGAWLLKNAKNIELSGKSVWHFVRCKMFSFTETSKEVLP